MALGIAAAGCGPQKKFCPDSGDGVCPDPVDLDAGVKDTYEAPEQDMGSIFVPQG